MDHITVKPFGFPATGRKKVTAAFDGGRLTSDGGVMRKRKPSPTFHGFEVTGDTIGPVQNVGRCENGRGVIRGA